MSDSATSSNNSSRKYSLSSSISENTCGFNENDNSEDNTNDKSNELTLNNSENFKNEKSSVSGLNCQVDSFVDKTNLEETQVIEVLHDHLKMIFGEEQFKTLHIGLFKLNYAAPYLKSLSDKHIDEFETESIKFAKVISHIHKKAASAIPCINKPAELFNHLTKFKKLHIGYVSSDFNNHVVMDFSMPLIHNFDSSRFNVYLYSTCKEEREDVDTTKCIKEVGIEYFRRCYGKSAQECASMIQADNIHILVDLTGWSGRSRLDIFCLRPAPVQVTYLGYCNTTGLNSENGMDYRLVDAFTDLKSIDNSLTNTSEGLWRLPKEMCFLGRDPKKCRFNGQYFECPAHHRYTTPALKHPKKTFTFGSFNNILKVNQAVVRVWTEILNRVPNSRLVIKSLQTLKEHCSSSTSLKEITHTNEITKVEFTKQQQARIRKMFELSGLINPECRIVFLDHESRIAHLLSYDDIDLSLDTFPYGGTSTTADSLLCSVPVVTYCPVNSVHATRVTGSILYRLGEEVTSKLIATNLSDYIDKVVTLANDLKGLNDLRNMIQPLFLASCVCQPAVFIRKLEKEYEKMWQLYTDKQNL